jgi:UDP-N-acetylmuramoylalanine--D-glutamate ligase
MPANAGYTTFYSQYFKGKRVTLMGLGLLGRGSGDARFLASLGAELIVTDLKTEKELESSLAGLKEFKKITYHLGGHRLEDFKDRDMIIKAAGVPLDSEYITEAHKNGVPVYMSTALFAQFAEKERATIVGVTGTRGKSTVAHLMYHALKEAGKPVHLGGNIRGLSTLEMLPQIKPNDLVVMELDSWQLQGFGDLKISPHIAVFTNLLEDHLNYYKSDPERYFWDKANIFLHQKSGDRLVVGAQVLGQIQKANPPVAPVVPSPLPEDWKLQLVGEHNKENAALAALALRMLGLNDAEIKAGLESFEPVEGRLQKASEIKGVAFYNDNNSTTPDATVAALDSFPKEKVIVIAGGTDKGLDTAKLVQELQKCKKVLLLAGTGTDKIKDSLNGLIYQSISEALKDAVAAAEAGDIILFSPAFASFGMFKNEYDRNDQFLAALKALS